MSLNWDDVRVFLAVARQGTLSGGAAELGLGLATMTRRLDRLEEALGVRLFTRSQNGCRLSGDGSDLLVQAEAMEEAGRALDASARGHRRVAGRVRLATAENLATDLVLPSLPPLLDRHPELEIELLTDVNMVNLHRRDADMAVRMIRPERGNLTLRRLGVLGFGLYGTASVLAGRERSERRPDPRTDRLIGWAESYRHLPAARWAEEAAGSRGLVLRTTTLASQVAAARAGLGLAVLPHFLGSRAGLDYLCSAPEVDREIWLVIHADLAGSPRVRVLSDHLVELFESAHDVLAFGSC